MSQRNRASDIAESSYEHHHTQSFSKTVAAALKTVVAGDIRRAAAQTLWAAEHIFAAAQTSDSPTTFGGPRPSIPYDDLNADDPLAAPRRSDFSWDATSPQTMFQSEVTFENSVALGKTMQGSALGPGECGGLFDCMLAIANLASTLSLFGLGKDIGLGAGRIAVDGLQTLVSQGAQRLAPNVVAHAGQDAGLELSSTVAGHAADTYTDLSGALRVTRPYLGSPSTVRAIMDSASGIADPGGLSGALRWDVAGHLNNSAGAYELVVDSGGRIVHFLFKGQ
jgi:hypothetical protein